MKMLVISTFLLMGNGLLLAAETTIQSCRAIEDNTKRLGCYDALADGVASSRPTVSGVTATAVAATIVESAPPAQPAPATTTAMGTVASVTPSVPAGTASDTATVSTSKSELNASLTSAEAERKQIATAEFGLEHRDPDRVDAIVSRIPGEFRGWEAKSRITLENGQVWQVSDGTRGAYLLNNPQVTIERGPLGGFVMRIEGVNRSPKVKRLK